MEIQKSNDYEIFQLINGNRKISTKKVNRIVEDVNSGLNLFPYCPIIVSESDGVYRIIDGQHRFMAAKSLQHPIHYIVAHHIKLRDIARMNTNTDKWKYSDFTKCYIDLGIKDYEVLRDYCRKYKVQLRIAIGLLMYGAPRNSSKDAEVFMDGEFKSLYYDFAVEFIELVDRLFSAYVFNRDPYLLMAVHKLNEKALWDIDAMEEKIQKHPNMMDRQSTVKTYIYLLEQIYNMRNQHRKTIF